MWLLIVAAIAFIGRFIYIYGPVKNEPVAASTANPQRDECVRPTITTFNNLTTVPTTGLYKLSVVSDAERVVIINLRAVCINVPDRHIMYRLVYLYKNDIIDTDMCPACQIEYLF